MRVRWWRLTVCLLTLATGLLALQMWLLSSVNLHSLQFQASAFVSSGWKPGTGSVVYRPSPGSDTKRHPFLALPNQFSAARNQSDSIGLKGLEKIDCVKAVEGFPSAPSGASLRSPVAVRVSDKEFVERTKDCRTFRERYGYGRYPPATAEELKFPLAFNILLYKEVVQLHVLLRAVYRPHNSYCLHVDGYASPRVFDATERLAACLPNVFMASRRENITYRGFTRLQADINCMKDHWNRSLLAASTSSSSSSFLGGQLQSGEAPVWPWRYLINLPSQEFPLKTNLEMVKILTIYNGSNSIMGLKGNHTKTRRFTFKHEYRLGSDGRLKVAKTNVKLGAPPHNLTVVKGSAYGVFSRAFVDFVLHDRRAIDLLDWCRAVNSPDEYYWAMLQHNAQLHAPGGYHGDPNEQWGLAVYVSWQLRMGCRSRKSVRGVCIFGVEDLPELVERKELFANKFYINFQPQALHCLDQWLVNKTYARLPVNTFYYRQLPFIGKG